MKNYPTQIANFAVTYRCNSRCQNCNIWQKEPEDELTLTEIIKFFTVNRDLLKGVKSIQLTGGEPFLRDDLPQIAATITKTIPRCMIWIPTNGLDPDRVKDHVLKMVNDGVKLGVSVSLDGIASINDNIRGVTGSYKLARKTLSSLSTIKKAQPRLNLSVGLTLTPENLREAPIIQRIAYNNGADFSFRPVNRSDFYYNNVQSESLDPDTLASVLKSIAYNAVTNKGRIKSLTTLRYIQGVYQYLSKGRVLPCTAGSNSFFLDPTGNIYPCLVMDHKLGNIREEPFESIWESEKAMEARDLVTNLKCPTCWLECEAYREINMDKIGLTKTLFRSLLNSNWLDVS